MSYQDTKRPLIGMVSSRDGGKMMMNLTYMNAVWFAGGLPVVLASKTSFLWSTPRHSLAL